MANLLESIGRTDALRSTTKDVAGFFGDLRRMKQEDVEAPMRMGLLQNQLEVSRQQVELNRNKMAEDARRAAEGSRLFRVKSLLSNAPSPSVGEALLERAMERHPQFIDQTDPNELMISGANLQEFWKGVEADTNFGNKLDILYYEDLRNSLNTLEKQRDEMKTSGKINDKTYLQLEQQIGDVEKKMTVARVRYNALAGKEEGAVKEFIVGDKTEYWETDNQGRPIRRVEGMGGGRYKPAGTTVNVGEQGAFEKELGKNLGEEYIKVQKEAVASANNLNRLNVLEKALEKGYQGKLAGLGSAIGAYYEVITGEKIAGASETQIAQAISNRIALTMVGAQVEGGGMPANLFSEADREFVVNANVNPKLTPEANKRLLALARKTEEFKVVYARAWRDYVEKHGTADAGVYSFIEKKVKKHFNLPEDTDKFTPSGGWGIKRID